MTTKVHEIVMNLTRSSSLKYLDQSGSMLHEESREEGQKQTQTSNKITYS